MNAEVRSLLQLRRIIVALAVASLAVVVAACGGDAKTNGDTKSNKPTTLTLLSFTGSPSDQPPIRKFYALYEKEHPGVKVKITFVPLANYAAVLRTRLLGGNATDVFRVTTAHDAGYGIWDLAPTGKLLPLNGQTWTNSVPPILRDAAGYQGKSYAWFNDFSGYWTFYNTELYNKAGVKPPTTFSEVLDACKTIRAKTGKIPFALGGGLVNAMYMINFAMASTTVLGRNPNWNTERSDGKTSFAATPGWTTQFKQYLAMRDAGCFQPNPVSTSFPEALSLMTSGKAASMVIVSVVRGALSTNPAIKLGAYVLPGSNNPSETRLGVQANDGVAISASTKHKAQALELLAWLSKAETSRQYGKITGSITADDARNARLPAGMEPLKPYFGSPDKMVLLPIVTWPAETAGGILGPDMQALYLGKKSIPQALSDLDKSYDKGFHG